MLLKAFLVIEEALKMALHQSSEIFAMPFQCTSLGTQIVTFFFYPSDSYPKNVLNVSENFHENADLSLHFIP